MAEAPPLPRWLRTEEPPTVLEICAGAGGQSIGLERAGFEHVAAIEIDEDACRTLIANRPGWDVIHADVRDVSGHFYEGVDLLAGGVPCPPFSIAGKRLGKDDERDLFPEALRLTREMRPRAVMIENVKGFAGRPFESYRAELATQFSALGYSTRWRVLNASHFGVPQLRPRFILVALDDANDSAFEWPSVRTKTPTVGKALFDLMSEAGWPGAAAWAERAQHIAPTIVGGSKKHGGPDLGPSRARAEWLNLGVDGRGIANAPPPADAPLDSIPRLTMRMVARLQGFPDDWRFAGGKTAAYRQIGNAFPPPVASAVASSILEALSEGAHDKREDLARLTLATPWPKQAIG
jgi:DNA (cytosine-5)-methyltransferase 1